MFTFPVTLMTQQATSSSIYWDPTVDANLTVSTTTLENDTVTPSPSVGTNALKKTVFTFTETQSITFEIEITASVDGVNPSSASYFGICPEAQPITSFYTGVGRVTYQSHQYVSYNLGGGESAPITSLLQWNSSPAIGTRLKLVYNGSSTVFSSNGNANTYTVPGALPAGTYTCNFGFYSGIPLSRSYKITILQFN